MKKRRIRALSFLTAACFSLTMMSFPMNASAEAEPFSVTEGDIVTGFAPEGTECSSDDPSVAWVDSSGALRAMKEGSTTIHLNGEDRPVTVDDYTDGSDIVGQLKILARYNDTMQFYDGHVYLLFTSYKDGVNITVNDLYGGYQIRDSYYSDIKADIANGSNHTGNDTENYFTFDDDMTSVTLDRGEIVTIGMYRGFDLSVPEAALGSFQNSTLWSSMNSMIKSILATKLFQILNEDPLTDTEGEIQQLIAELTASGFDYNQLLDGVVEGGVCFNRELYNQKLEWDQYENVTYEMDITQAQLDKMTMYLQGNLNNFSIFKNSCATVALRAWNAAVGTRDGAPTSYRLEASGEGIFTLIDAPKTVKDEIMKKLPGYYLNNSEGVAEPNAGFVDDTGWVYVSAPERLPEDDEQGESEPSGKHELTVRVEGSGAECENSVYIKGADGEMIPLALDGATPIDGGTKIYVRANVSDTDFDYAVNDITLNGSSILGGFDEGENAYTAVMPDKNAVLRIKYDKAVLTALNSNHIQLKKGEVIDLSELVELKIGGSVRSRDEIGWESIQSEDYDAVSADETGCIVTADNEGNEVVLAYAKANERIFIPFFIEVYENTDDMVKVTFNDESFDDYYIVSTFGGEENIIPCSGYKVKKGSRLNVITDQYDPKVVSSFTVNGSPARLDDSFTADGDTDIRVEFRNAEIVNMPATIRMNSKDDSYSLSAYVRYSDLLHRYETVYDPTISYVSSDPIISVDENGVITLTEDIPDVGKNVIVTAYAGSGNRQVKAETRVILGDYSGARPVGRLTIWARPIVEAQLVSHSAVSFITYEDIDLDVSFYNYFKPTEEYKALMEEYRDHPETFPSDPALFSTEIPINDRESYFEEIHNGSDSEPVSVKLKAGEGFTVSNYCYEPKNLITIRKALQGSLITSSEQAQELVKQIDLYLESSEDFDGEKAFDSTVATLMQIYAITSMTGYNPADGHAEGGLDLNREVYNQFRRTDSQLPNTYYTVELTADELELLKSYLADPANNYYSLFNMNCASGAVNLWNAALSDRPDLHIQGNYTGFAKDPMSVYADLELLRLKTAAFNGTGEGHGTNYVPHIAPAYYKDLVFDRPAAKVGLIYNGKPQELVFAGKAEDGSIQYALGLAGETAPADGWSEEVPSAVNAGSYFVWYRIKGNNADHEESGVIAVIIEAAEIAAAASDVSVTFDGKPHGITVDVTEPESGFTVMYGTKEGVYDLTEAPLFTETGSYLVYYCISADNYKTKTGSAAVKIKAADIPDKPEPSAPDGPAYPDITFSYNLGYSKARRAYSYSPSAPTAALESTESRSDSSTAAAATNTAGGQTAAAADTVPATGENRGSEIGITVLAGALALIIYKGRKARSVK